MEPIEATFAGHRFHINVYPDGSTQLYLKDAKAADKFHYVWTGFLGWCDHWLAREGDYEARLRKAFYRAIDNEFSNKETCEAVKHVRNVLNKG